MNFYLLVSALFLQSAQADFNGDIGTVNSAANYLKNKVDNWNSNSGLIAALGIQGYFPTLSDAVKALSNDVGSISNSDVDPDTIVSFTASIAELLNGLTDKAQDFKAVGAGSIVANDISQLSGPAVGIVDGIISVLSGDCDKIRSLTDGLNAVTNGFSAANSAYGNSQVQFVAPGC